MNLFGSLGLSDACDTSRRGLTLVNWQGLRYRRAKKGVGIFAALYCASVNEENSQNVSALINRDIVGIRAAYSLSHKWHNGVVEPTL